MWKCVNPARLEQRWRLGTGLTAVLVLTLTVSCRTTPSSSGEVIDNAAADSSAAVSPEVGSPVPSDGSCCSESKELGIAAASDNLHFDIPDVEVIDQNGEELHFYADLVKGRTVAMSFFFTSCKTICPPLTVTMREVQKLAFEHDTDIQLISVTVDANSDSPTRLKRWADAFGAEEGWSFITGSKGNVDALLKALQVFTPEPSDHTPMILIGNDVSGEWKQIYGLSPATEIHAAIASLAPKRASAEEQPSSATVPDTDAAVVPQTSAKNIERPDNPKAHAYFTDVEVTDQFGQKQRLYTDLMQGRTIVVACFFTECVGVCPPIMKQLQCIQSEFESELGNELVILCLSVDGSKDTPARLRSYARGWNARAGWYFLTGEPENISLALKKFGLYTDNREAHSNQLRIGNDRTGLWKKAFALGDRDELMRIVDSVLRDEIVQGASPERPGAGS